MKRMSAYEYGREAFNNGFDAPVYDTDFLDEHIAGTHTGEAEKPLEEWMRGWHQAKKEVEFLQSK